LDGLSYFRNLYYQRMKKLRRMSAKNLFCICTLLFSNMLYAQQDSSSSDKTYDIVCLTKGGTIKGQILSFNEKEGSLVFKDQENRTYALGRNEYDYFKENLVYDTKKIQNIRARKDEGFEVNLGFSWESFNGPDYGYSYSTGEYSQSYYLVPLSLKVGAGKYFAKQHFLGATAALGLVTDAKLYANGGLRYSYIFTSDKRNVVLYIPVETKFYHMNKSQTIYGNGGLENRTFDLLVQSVGLSAGTGFSFTRANKKSISIEGKFTKHFPSELKLSNIPDDVTVSSREMKLGSGSLVLSYNF